ncbi:MAG: hypothetical protein EOP42_01215 [Sphingobacteriaceae bacterium]|nr:MAG: hypothetical protein EOP42_01215 [Sphingobacteriaceae bacterium]
MLAELTLIINLCPADASYAALTAGYLAKSHRKQAKEIIIIIDDTKAQHSDFYNHQERYREPEFSINLEKIIAIANQMQANKLADEVLILSKYAAVTDLHKKYLKNRLTETHDFRGAPITAYLAGFEACKTQYMVRYDGDMLLHQSSVDWVLTGITLLQQHADCIAVSPQPAPSKIIKSNLVKTDPTYWFSTRCTLFDRIKMLSTTPFIYGKYRRELLLRKWMQKTYPPALETMVFERFKSAGLKNYYLLNQGWLIHPEQKDQLFVKLLPKIISEVEKGNFPKEQANKETLDLQAWEKYLQPV